MLKTPQSANNKFSINHDAWHCNVEKRKYSSSLVEWSHTLTSAIYKEVLKTKVLPWAKKITKKPNYVIQPGGAPAYTAKTVQDWLDANMSFWPKYFFPPQSPDLNPLDLSLRTLIEERLARHTTAKQISSRLLYMAVDEERLCQKNLKEFPTSIRPFFSRQRWLHSII